MEQSALLQNFLGDESIVGRSIALIAGEETTPRACCVIARDIDPTSPADELVHEEEEEEVHEPAPVDPWLQAK